MPIKTPNEISAAYYLMSADLRVVVFHGCTFFRIYRLEDGVLSVLRFNGYNCLLDFSLALR